MITIQKLEKGYGAFLDGCLILVEEKPDGYKFLIDSVISTNIELKSMGVKNV